MRQSAYLDAGATGAVASAFFTDLALLIFFALWTGFEAAFLGATAAASLSAGASTFLAICFAVAVCGLATTLHGAVVTVETERRYTNLEIREK
jgi:hypothetical protein